MALVAAAALLLASGLLTEVGVRSEARAGAPDGEALQLDGIGSIDLGAPSAHARLSYAPRLVWGWAPETSSPLLMNRAAAEGGFQLGGGSELTVVERLSYGQEDFSAMSALATGGVGAFGRVQLAAPVRFASTDTAAGFSQSIRQQGKISVGLSALISGGADEESRINSPLQHAYSASAAGEWTLRQDRLGAGMRFTRNFITNGPPSSSTNAGLRWERQATPFLAVHANLGLTVIVGPHQRTFMPDAEAGLAFVPLRGSPGTRAAASARVAPFIDPTTGLTVSRIDLRGTLAIPLVAHLSFDASAEAARGVTSANPGQIYWLATASVGWTPQPWLLLSGGFRALRDTDQRWAAFVGLAVSRRDAL